MNASDSSSDRRLAIAAIVAVNAMWGCSFPVMKALNFEIDQHFKVTELTASNALRIASAAWMLAIRFGFALLLFVVFFRSTMRRVRLPHILAGAAIGTTFFLGMVLQITGLATIPASRSGFLTSLVVIFAPILQALIGRQLPRPVVVCGAVVALAGVAILTGLIEIQDGNIGFAGDALTRWTAGDSLTTLAAMFFTGQILMIDAFGKRYESIAFTPSMFATTTVLAAVVFGALQAQIPEAAANAEWLALTFQPRFIVLIAMLSVFASLLAFAWMNKFQPQISAGQAAVIYTLEPLFASLWAMVLPGVLSVFCAVVYANESFSVPLVIGGGLVMLANILALWPERRVNGV